MSVDSLGTLSNGNSRHPAISADGRYVVFDSDASNLVATPPTSGFNVYLHDRQTGVTELVSINAAGEQGTGSDLWPSVSADGRFATFSSSSTNLVPGDTSDPYYDIFVRDRLLNTMEKITWGVGGEASNGTSGNAIVSVDGRFVIFTSFASNLILGDTNQAADVFLYDHQTAQLERVSSNFSGGPVNGDSYAGAISPDGRLIAFHSWGSTVVIDDTNNTSDVFVFDRLLRRSFRLSVSTAGAAGDGPSVKPAMAMDGFLVAFMSEATNLVVDDMNDNQDVFVHQWQLFTQFLPAVFKP